jgi:uncharacterized protein with HEPN domain
MYSPRNILYIISAISSIDKIADYTSQFEDADTLLKANNQLNFNGTLTLLIAIAEETKKIDKQLLLIQPNIQWQNIADMRNVLAHDYRGIDPEIVFDVIKNELPKLRIALTKMLPEFPHSSIVEILDTKMYMHLRSIID